MKHPKVASFPELIRWIADHHHDGAVLPIAGKVGVSPALVNLWVKGNTKEPRPSNLQALATAYDLDFLWLLGLVHGKRLAPISGGSGVLGTLCVAQVLDYILSYRPSAHWWAWLMHPLIVCPA